MLSPFTLSFLIGLGTGAFIEPAELKPGLNPLGKAYKLPYNVGWTGGPADFTGTHLLISPSKLPTGLFFTGWTATNYGEKQRSLLIEYHDSVPQAVPSLKVQDIDSLDIKKILQEGLEAVLPATPCSDARIKMKKPGYKYAQVYVAIEFQLQDTFLFAHHQYTKTIKIPLQTYEGRCSVLID